MKKTADRQTEFEFSATIGRKIIFLYRKWRDTKNYYNLEKHEIYRENIHTENKENGAGSDKLLLRKENTNPFGSKKKKNI